MRAGVVDAARMLSVGGNPEMNLMAEGINSKLRRARWNRCFRPERQACAVRDPQCVLPAISPER